MTLTHFLDKSIKTLDLTHSLHPNIPSYEVSCGFNPRIEVDYDQGFRLQRVEMRAGIGTHIDAPAHFVQGAADIAQLKLENLLMVPACVINVSAKAYSEYAVTPEDIQFYEQQFDKIPRNALIVFHTGWSQHWENATQYRNEDAQGIKHFPSVTAATAQLLVERQIAGIAIDTLSPDSSDLRFPVHHILLGNNKYIIENIANTENLPPAGATILVLPMKFAGGTEAPVRVIGLIP